MIILQHTFPSTELHVALQLAFRESLPSYLPPAFYLFSCRLPHQAPNGNPFSVHCSGSFGNVSLAENMAFSLGNPHLLNTPKYRGMGTLEVKVNLATLSPFPRPRLLCATITSLAMFCRLFMSPIGLCFLGKCEVPPPQSLRTPGSVLVSRLLHVRAPTFQRVT